MDCGGAVYARVPAGGAEALAAAIVRARRSPNQGPLGVVAFDPAAHAFALVDRWGRSDDLPGWAEGPDLAEAGHLAALSGEVGEVVAFYEVEGGLELGLYAHWRDGALARELQYADGEWLRVEGEPQAWEAGLFAPPVLARALSDAADDRVDPAPIQAAFAAGRLAQGARWPRPGIAVQLAALIREALRAPAYGVQPWPRRRDAVRALSPGR